MTTAQGLSVIGFCLLFILGLTMHFLYDRKQPIVKVSGFTATIAEEHLAESMIAYVKENEKDLPGGFCVITKDDRPANRSYAYDNGSIRLILLGPNEASVDMFFSEATKRHSNESLFLTASKHLSKAIEANSS